MKQETIKTLQSHGATVIDLEPMDALLVGFRGENVLLRFDDSPFEWAGRSARIHDAKAAFNALVVGGMRFGPVDRATKLEVLERWIQSEHKNDDYTMAVSLAVGDSESWLFAEKIPVAMGDQAIRTAEDLLELIEG